MRPLLQVFVLSAILVSFVYTVEITQISIDGSDGEDEENPIAEGN